MERIKKLILNPKYKEYIEKNYKAEKERKFCHHDIEHFLSVGRIMYIRVLEEKLNFSKEIIYATALLHDIGRFKEYEYGISHDIASAEIANELLKNCGFQREEIDLITTAIMGHRGSNNNDSRSSLGELLYMADKSSRNCEFCAAFSDCNWSDDKKLMHLIHLN